MISGMVSTMVQMNGTASACRSDTGTPPAGTGRFRPRPAWPRRAPPAPARRRLPAARPRPSPRSLAGRRTSRPSAGIVMNGPIPPICVTLIAVAGSKPTERRKVRGRPAPASPARSGPPGISLCRVCDGWGFAPGQREALREARRDTAVTAESACCNALALRVAGSRCSAARARRWTATRASGNAMASSIKRRSRRKRNHMISVPSCGRDSGPSEARLRRPQRQCPEAGSRYPQWAAVITGRSTRPRQECLQHPPMTSRRRPTRRAVRARTGSCFNPGSPRSPGSRGHAPTDERSTVCLCIGAFRATVRICMRP